MTYFGIDPNTLNHDQVTLNLRHDERGYYWETESGEDTDARFDNADKAIAEVTDLWSTRGGTRLSATTRYPSSSGKRKATGNGSSMRASLKHPQHV